MPKSKTSLKELLHEVRRIEESRKKLTEKKIQSIYRSLMKDLKAFLADEYIKYADDEGRFYMAYLDAKNKRAKFLQEIVENVDGISAQVRAEMMSLVNETYEACYKGMSEAVKKADRAGIMEEVTKDITTRPEVLKQAVNNNISKLTLPAVLEKNRNEVIYQIQQELTTGLLNGDRYEKMAKRISERVDVSYNKAINVARTESHRNIESGFMDCAESIQDDLGGSDLIYTATWRTMDDGKVRPFQRYKTKSGWKTKLSRNGANHVKMEGVTVKAGEFFDLGAGVKAKAPSQSGVAAHDCRCRCFLEYNLMTIEEFEKATGKAAKIAAVHRTVRQEMNNNSVADFGLQRTTDAEAFDKAIKAAIKSQPIGACVDAHPIEELKEYKLFLSKSETAGVAVKPDGDITAVFKDYNDKRKGAVNDLIITARENGGTKMDCFGISLVNKYESCGYVPVARIPFNEKYIDDPYLLEHRPDVYAMMKNTDKIETVIEKNAKRAYKKSMQQELDNLPTFEDYDEALKYRDELLKIQEGK